MKRQFLMVALAALSSASMAQLAGPAPLNWKWQGSTSVVPGEFVAHGNSIIAAVGRRIYALDRETGNQLWRWPADGIQGNFNRGTILAGDVVIAPADNRTIYAFNANSGEKIWEYNLQGGLASNPVVAGGYVVLPMGDDTLVALNPKDGTPAWANPISVPGGIMGKLAASGNDIFVTTSNFELAAIDTVRAAQRWKVQFTQLNPDAIPVVAEDTVYIIAGDYVIGLARQNGGQRARITVGEQAVFGPAIAANTVTVVTRQGSVRTYTKQGRPTHPPVDLQSMAVNTPVIVGGKIVVNTSNGSMNMIEPADGSILWNYILRPATKPVADSSGKTPPNYMTAASAVFGSGDTLYLNARDGQILAFDSKAGVDLTPPFVSFVFPVNGYEMSGRSNVAAGEQPPFFLWDVEDLASGVRMDTVKVEIDNRVAKHLLTRDGQLVVRINGSENPGLSDGPKTITVTASDWMGNTSKSQFRVMIDNTLPALKSATGGTSGSGAGVGAGTGDGSGRGSGPR